MKLCFCTKKIGFKINQHKKGDETAKPDLSPEASPWRDECAYFVELQWRRHSCKYIQNVAFETNKMIRSGLKCEVGFLNDVSKILNRCCQGREFWISWSIMPKAEQSFVLVKKRNKWPGNKFPSFVFDFEVSPHRHKNIEQGDPWCSFRLVVSDERPDRPYPNPFRSLSSMWRNRSATWNCRSSCPRTAKKC